MFKDTIIKWSEHKCSTFGAALAYYSIFSFGPLLLIAIGIAGMVFGADAVRGEVSTQVRDLLGNSGAQALEGLLAGANHPKQGLVATIVGIGTLLFAAVSIVAQLKTALNIVWEVKPSPRDSGWWPLVRTYLVSLAGVLALGFLLLASMLFTAGLSAASQLAAGYIPSPPLHIAAVVISFVLVTALFAMMFKWLPDAPVDWWDSLLGGLLTAALFEIGKFVIGYYIGKLGLESTYGATASLVMLLIWVYYTSQIILLGAEFTHVYSLRNVARQPAS